MFTTARLSVRSIMEEDRALFCELFGSERVMKFVGPVKDSNSLNQSFEKILELQRGSADCWRYYVISQIENGDKIGMTSLLKLTSDTTEVSLGIVLHPRFQGKMYVQEVLEPLCKFAFSSLSIESISIEVHKKNLPALKHLKRLGFQESGRIASTFGLKSYCLAKPAQYVG